MTHISLSPDLAFKLKSMPRGRQSLHQINHTCNQPFRSVVVDRDSNCFICSCHGWLPIPVGKVQDFSSLEEIWQSPQAQLIQQDILNKKFTWCAIEHCGIRLHDINRKSYSLGIDIDDSCNLRCPSCRREQIMHDTKSAEFLTKKADIEKILGWLQNFDKPITVTMSGNGDVLASHITRPLLKNWQPRDDQHIKLITNGLLIKKQLSGSPIINHLTTLSISVDAGSKDVYEKVRLGGSWQILLENLDYVKSTGLATITNLNFVLQNGNYQDLDNFVLLCNKYGVSGNVHQLDDWGTWNNQATNRPDTWTNLHGYFQEHDVLHPSHRNYTHCKQIVTNIFLKKLDYIKFSQHLPALLDLNRNVS